tara:strand:- start:11 stop:286 length:276 start_codon:yes stop_codon:yes gene_type:complete
MQDLKSYYAKEIKDFILVAQKNIISINYMKLKYILDLIYFFEKIIKDCMDWRLESDVLLSTEWFIKLNPLSIIKNSIFFFVIKREHSLSLN